MGGGPAGIFAALELTGADWLAAQARPLGVGLMQSSASGIHAARAVAARLLPPPRGLGSEPAPRSGGRVV